MSQKITREGIETRMAEGNADTTIVGCDVHQTREWESGDKVFFPGVTKTGIRKSIIFTSAFSGYDNTSSKLFYFQCSPSFENLLEIDFSSLSVAENLTVCDFALCSSVVEIQNSR